jgi:hypothetical protein
MKGIKKWYGNKIDGLGGNLNILNNLISVERIDKVSDKKE